MIGPDRVVGGIDIAVVVEISIGPTVALQKVIGPHRIVSSVDEAVGVEVTFHEVARLEKQAGQAFTWAWVVKVTLPV